MMACHRLLFPYSKLSTRLLDIKDGFYIKLDLIGPNAAEAISIIGRSIKYFNHREHSRFSPMKCTLETPYEGFNQGIWNVSMEI